MRHVCCSTVLRRSARTFCRAISREGMRMGTIVNCVAYCEGQRVESVEIERISEVLQHNDRFIWIGLREPTHELLMQIQQAFGLHELAIEDALGAHQRPKIELYGDSLFVVLRTAHMNPERRQIEF